MSKQLVQLYFRNLDITARNCFSAALWPCSSAAIKRFSALALSCLACSVVMALPPVPSCGGEPPSGSGSLRLRRGLPVLLRTGELRDLDSANLGDRLLAAGLRGVFARGNLTLDLNMRALGEPRCVVRKPPPADNSMPGRLRLPR